MHPSASIYGCIFKLARLILMELAPFLKFVCVGNFGCHPKDLMMHILGAPKNAPKNFHGF